MLSVSQSTSGEWRLSASIELKAKALETALREAQKLDVFFVPADADAVDDALASLKSATSRPIWMDNSDAINWEETIATAMADYPTDVVLSACKAWRQVPQHGKWWPTEQDLRQQCEAIFFPRKSLFNRARVLLQELRTRELPAPTVASAFAGDKAQKFHAGMRQKMLERTFNAYFHPSHIAFRGDEIIVRSRTAARELRERGEGLLRQLGLRVRFDQSAFLNVREPTWEDDTPQEREETALRFHQLKEALAKGANIKELRRQGVL